MKVQPQSIILHSLVAALVVLALIAPPAGSTDTQGRAAPVGAASR